MARSHATHRLRDESISQRQRQSSTLLSYSDSNQRPEKAGGPPRGTWRPAWRDGQCGVRAVSAPKLISAVGRTEYVARRCHAIVTPGFGGAAGLITNRGHRLKRRADFHYSSRFGSSISAQLSPWPLGLARIRSTLRNHAMSADMVSRYGRTPPNPL